MFNDLTSGQSDSFQCRHCGMKLAARLLSCPACGASQAEPLGWFPPAIVSTGASASAGLPAPRSAIAPQLAQPAAWDTPAGIADDEFYARHDPWVEPKRSGKLRFAVAGIVLLAAVAIAGYFLFRSYVDSGHGVSKATYGAVTTQQLAQQARPTVADRAKSTAAVDSARSADTAPAASMLSGVPKANGPAKLAESKPVDGRQAEVKQAETRQAETKQAAVTPVEVKPATPTLAAPKPEAQSLAAQSRTDLPALGQGSIMPKLTLSEAPGAASKPQFPALASGATPPDGMHAPNVSTALSASNHPVTNGLVAPSQSNVTGKASLSSQPDATKGLLASNKPDAPAKVPLANQLSLTNGPAVSNPSNVTGKASMSNQPGAMSGLVASNQLNAAAGAPVSNQHDTATVPSVPAQVSAVNKLPAARLADAAPNPIASSKQSVPSQPAASRPNPGAADASRRLASASAPSPSESKHESKISAEQTNREVARNLQVARTMLAKGELTSARSHLTIAMFAQPDNRDALVMDASLSAREQQRDAALETARSCESSGRWICAWHNAGSAIVMDPGNADAKRILSHAMQEAEAARTPVAAVVEQPPHAPLYHH